MSVPAPRSPNHLGANEQVSVGEIDVSVSGSGHDEFYRAARIERRDRLVFYPATLVDARLRRRYGEQVEFALHALARLTVNEGHARKTRLRRRRYGVFSLLALRVRLVVVSSYVSVQLVSRVCLEAMVSRADSVANLFRQSSSSVSPQSGYSDPIIHHQQFARQSLMPDFLAPAHRVYSAAQPFGGGPQTNCRIRAPAGRVRPQSMAARHPLVARNNRRSSSLSFVCCAATAA